MENFFITNVEGKIFTFDEFHRKTGEFTATACMVEERFVESLLSGYPATVKGGKFEYRKALGTCKADVIHPYKSIIQVGFSGQEINTDILGDFEVLGEENRKIICTSVLHHELEMQGVLRVFAI